MVRTKGGFDLLLGTRFACGFEVLRSFSSSGGKGLHGGTPFPDLCFICVVCRAMGVCGRGVERTNAVIRVRGGT